MGLIRGTLDVLVLKTISWTPMAAFEIARWLEDRSDGRLTIDGPALIQALHCMEERKFVSGQWGVTENGRRARYYGSLQLAERTSRQRLPSSPTIPIR